MSGCVLGFTVFRRGIKTKDLSYDLYEKENVSKYSTTKKLKETS